MHKETLINIITCTRTTPPPPPISSSTTMIFPTSQMWRDPKKYGPNVKYPNSKPQKPNLCKDIYRYRLVLMLLPQTRFKQMQNLSFERAVGWPKKVLKNKIAAQLTQNFYLEDGDKEWGRGEKKINYKNTHMLLLNHNIQWILQNINPK